MATVLRCCVLRTQHGWWQQQRRMRVDSLMTAATRRGRVPVEVSSSGGFGDPAHRRFELLWQRIQVHTHPSEKQVFPPRTAPEIPRTLRMTDCKPSSSCTFIFFIRTSSLKIHLYFPKCSFIRLCIRLCHLHSTVSFFF